MPWSTMFAMKLLASFKVPTVQTFWNSSSFQTHVNGVALMSHALKETSFSPANVVLKFGDKRVPNRSERGSELIASSRHVDSMLHVMFNV